MSADYRLADIARLSGARRRSIQLWADAGVLKPEPFSNRAGTGTHRLFPEENVLLAKLINTLAQRQIAIGELRSMADAIRPLLNADLDYIVLSTNNGGIWHACAAGRMTLGADFRREAHPFTIILPWPR